MLESFLENLRAAERANKRRYIFRIFGGTRSQQPAFLGTGFLVTPRWLITCKHVVMEPAFGQEGKPKLIQEQLLIQLNETIGTRIHVSSENVKFDDDFDIALIELPKPINVPYPQLVRRITRNVESFLERQRFSAIGFKMTTKGRRRDHASIRLIMPVYDDHTGHLTEIQFRGGPAKGCSGGPVIYDSFEEDVCVGMLYLGSEPAATARVIASDELRQFISKHTLQNQKNLRQIDAKYVFGTSQVKKLPKDRRRAPGISAIALAILGCVVGIFGFREYRATRNRAISKASALSKDSKDCKLHPPKPFGKDPALKILILSFYGNNAESSQFGQATGMRLQAALDEYKLQEMNTQAWHVARLSDDGLKTSFSDCYVNDISEALVAGENANANLVIWGRVFYEKSASASGHGDIIPYITSVDWPVMQSVAAQSVGPVGLHTLSKMSFPQLSTDRLMPLIRFMIGLYAFQNQRYQLAANYLKEVAESHIPGLAQAWPFHIIWSNSLVLAGRYDDAEVHLQEISRICSTNAEKSCLAYILYLRTESFIARGRFIDAQKLVSNETIPLSRELDDSVLHVMALTQLTRIEQAIGNPDDAAKLAKLAVQTAVPMIALQCATCNTAGFSSWKSAVTGDLPSVLKAYQQGEPIWNQTNNYKDKAIAAENISVVYLSKKQYQEAIDWAKKARALYEVLGMPGEVAQSSYSIATASEALQRRSDAKSYLEDSLAAFQLAPFPTFEASVRSKLAIIYLDEGNKEKASLVLHGVHLSGLSNIQEDGATLERLSIAYSRLGRFELAVKHMDLAIRLLEGLNLNKKLLPQLYLNKGAFSEKLGDIRSASLAIAAGAKILFDADSALLAHSFLDYICDMAIRKRYPAECQAVLGKIHDDYYRPLAYSLMAQARAHTRLGNLKEARGYYNKLASLWSARNEKLPATVNQIVSAGIARIQHGGILDGCVGILVTNIESKEILNIPVTAGDVITRIGGRCVSTEVGYHTALRLASVGDISLRLWRSGKVMQVTISAKSANNIVTSFF